MESGKVGTRGLVCMKEQPMWISCEMARRYFRMYEKRWKKQQQKEDEEDEEEEGNMSSGVRSRPPLYFNAAARSSTFGVICVDVPYGVGDTRTSTTSESIQSGELVFETDLQGFSTQDRSRFCGG